MKKAKNCIQLPVHMKKGQLDLTAYLDDKEVRLTAPELAEIQTGLDEALTQVLSKEAILGWRSRAHAKMAKQLRAAQKTLAGASASKTEDKKAASA